MGVTVRRGLVLWGAFVVPCAIGWWLVLLLAPHGQRVFAQVWRSMAHGLAVPLVLTPLTDRCFGWLAHGGVPAFAGFLILITLWALMLAIPLTLLLSWAHWLGRMLVPHTSTSLVSGGSGDTIPYATTVSPATRLLYLITIPLGMAWYALRYLCQSLPAAIGAFIVIFIVRFCWQLFQLVNRSAFFFYSRVVAMDHLWHGLYARFGFHHLFAGLWRQHFTPVHQLSHQYLASPVLVYGFRDHPERYPDVLWLLVLDATMFALLCAVAFWGLAVVWRTIKHLSA